MRKDIGAKGQLGWDIHCCEWQRRARLARLAMRTAINNLLISVAGYGSLATLELMLAKN